MHLMLAGITLRFRLGGLLPRLTFRRKQAQA
jgi:hypothetical protein